MKGGKFLYRVDEVAQLTSARPPSFRRDPQRPFGEFWGCDGEWFYDRDRNTKTETQIELPPAQRSALAESSPWSFLIGAKIDKLKQRYWIRCIKTDDKTVWIEAWPKWESEAGCYSRVQLVLSRKDIFPIAMIVFAPNWTSQREHKQIYQFSEREERKTDGLLDSVQGFFAGELPPGDPSQRTASSSLVGQAFSPGIVPAGYRLAYHPWIEPREFVTQRPSEEVSLASWKKPEPAIQPQVVSTDPTERVVSCSCSCSTKKRRAKPRRALLRRK